MIYLITEETTVYMMGVSTRTEIKGYYKCDEEEEVKEFCKRKKEELKGTYNEDRMSKSITYKELTELE